MEVSRHALIAIAVVFVAALAVVGYRISKKKSVDAAIKIGVASLLVTILVGLTARPMEVAWDTVLGNKGTDKAESGPRSAPLQRPDAEGPDTSLTAPEAPEVAKPDAHDTVDPSEASPYTEAWPSRFVGTWKGSALNFQKGTRYTIEFTLHSGELGELIGTARSFDPDCRGELKLTEVTDTLIRATEYEAPGKCGTGTEFYARFELMESGQIKFQYLTVDNPRAEADAEATLTRVKP